VSVPEQWIADEVHRANHIAGVVFEGSVALAAAAAVTAFQLEDKAVWVAAGIAALSVLPGYIAAWTFLWNPLMESTTELQRATLARKTKVVH
jgi:hypothetical protein